MRRSRFNHGLLITGGPARSVLRNLIALPLIVGAAFVFAARDVHAQVSSSECCAAMLFPIGARTVALGQAVTAMAGLEAMFVNPAGLVDQKADEFVAHRAALADNKVTTLSVLLVSRGVGVFGFTYRLIDFGSQDETDINGNPLGSLSVIDQQLIASFATHVREGMSAGVSYRLYDFRPTCTGLCADAAKPGTTHLIDFGVQLQPKRLKGAVLGASLIQFGFPLQVNNAAQADPTPARLRGGIAYEVGHVVRRDSTTTAWLHVDLVARARSISAPVVNVGLEIILDNTIFLRAGHASAGDGITSGGTGIGVGLKYQRFDVSVAKTITASPVFENAGEPFHVSFAVSF